MTLKKISLINILLSLAISGCSINQEKESGQTLPLYIYKTWIHSYEGKSHYSSKIQIYHPAKYFKPRELMGYQMRFSLGKDGSCTYLHLSQQDFYSMQPCRFTYQNSVLQISDLRQSERKIKPFNILDISKDKLVIKTDYVVP